MTRRLGGSRPSRGHAGLGLVCLLAVLFANTAVGHAELSKAEKEKLPQMTEWAFRNSAVTDPLPCAEVCANLWTAEQAPMLDLFAKQELFNQIDTYLVNRGLWPTLEQLQSAIGPGGQTDIGAGTFVIGWHVKGAHDKWMGLEQEGAPGTPELRWCNSEGSYNEKLVKPGEPYGASVEGGRGLPPQPVTHGWTFVGGQDYCYFGGVGYYSETGPVPSCTPPSPPPPAWSGGWTNETQMFGVCEAPEYEHPRTRTNIDTALRTLPFQWWKPEDYEGQTATKVVVNAEAELSPATPKAAEEALQSYLEDPEHRMMREWLRFHATGEGRDPTQGPSPEEQRGSNNPGEPNRPVNCTGKPVNCATGNESLTQTDLRVGGRGIPLVLTRSYNSQAAASEAGPGPFGYGWSATFTDHIAVNSVRGTATVYQAGGSAVTFTGAVASTGELTAPRWAQARLVVNADGSFTYILPNQTTEHFDATGRLLTETDRNGNATTVAYNGSGLPETVTDASGRKLTLAYNAGGQVESARDPMGHEVKYAYESGNLVTVTLPGETTANWRFAYDASHQLTELTDGRGGKTINEYDSAHRVTLQTDPLGHKLKLEYRTESEPHYTVMTNVATGAVTREYFDGTNELTARVRAYGTAAQTTESFTYGGTGTKTSQTDGNQHTTQYKYDNEGNRTSEVSPDRRETKWTYDGKHNVVSVTAANGEVTTIKRDSHGNAETIERPAPAGKTQTYKYKYASSGDLESATDPLERVTKYEYDSHGDRTAAIDPAGDKTTWGYDEDSAVTSTVSPRGHVKAGEEEKYMTKIERDTQERPLTITDPLKHTTKRAYDANGNIATATDEKSNTTSYSYDANNRLTKVKYPTGTVAETGYDGAGQVVTQIDGNKHITKYERNALEEVKEVVDPLGRKTLKEYDGAGNLITLTDAEKRATSYTYDPANLLVSVSHSDGKTPTVTYEYDADGDRTKMTDGTGTTTYKYDQLDRLTETNDGHGDVVGYEYDLANERTKITYPNTKTVTRTYDSAGRLKTVTDWAERTTSFGYNADSNLTGITYPTAAGNEDSYVYDEADRMKEAAFKKGSTATASIKYERNEGGQVTKASDTGLAGAAEYAFSYDGNSRLKEGASVGYEYDNANNPKAIGIEKLKYDEANELAEIELASIPIKFAYNAVGQRAKRTPTTGAATTYEYDQAGRLTAISRPAGTAPAIEDTYSYRGDGLRASRTSASKTTYYAWDVAQTIPLLLSDEANLYIYGPEGIPIEQANSEGGAPKYLHTDQQGSVRMITGAAGEKLGSFTYDGYGYPNASNGTVTSALGYDGQYTDADTGLIYLRARYYDPATAQFLTVDPATSLTRAPYNFVSDNPLNLVDPKGLEAVPLPAPVAGACAGAPEVCGAAAVGAADVFLGAKVFNAWAGEEGGNDEGEASLKQRQAEEAEAERERNCGETPPGYNPDTWTKGPASREKEPGENYFDPEGGEWHYHPPDARHDRAHWDYKRLPGKLAPWEKIYLE